MHCKTKTIKSYGEELIKNIQNIIGNKLTFTPSYTEQKGEVKIGVGERKVLAVTKKYVYVNCWLDYGYNKQGEYGAMIKRYPLMRLNGSQGKAVNKVALEDLFCDDLKKLLKDIQFFLWFVSDVEVPKLQKQMDELLEYKRKFDKMMNLDLSDNHIKDLHILADLKQRMEMP